MLFFLLLWYDLLVDRQDPTERKGALLYILRMYLRALRAVFLFALLPQCKRLCAALLRPRGLPPLAALCAYTPRTLHQPRSASRSRLPQSF